MPASRFEREITDFHGVSPRRVEVFQADEPVRVRETRIRSRQSFRQWWRETPPLERAWRIWLYTVVGVVSFAAVFIAILIAAMVAGAFTAS